MFPSYRDKVSVFFASLDRYSSIIHAIYYYLMHVHYIIISFKIGVKYGHLFADVVLIMKQKRISFYTIAVLSWNLLCGASRIVSNVQWQGLSYCQKVDLSLFGFSRVQQFIKESKHCLVCLVFSFRLNLLNISL